MFDRKNFTRVFDDSGMTKAELAKLYGVSRQTIYAWKDGHSTPVQKTVAEREQLYTRGLLAAMNKGLLPLPKQPAQRKERLLKMAQALHDLAKPR
jgi:uncharacterized protein YjcR